MLIQLSGHLVVAAFGYSPESGGIPPTDEVVAEAAVRACRCAQARLTLALTLALALTLTLALALTLALTLILALILTLPTGGGPQDREAGGGQEEEG